jgi:hypothetical protein
MGWSGRAPALPARQAGKGPCLIGMEARTGAHHLNRKLQALGHDARLMPTNYVRPYSKGDKNDYRDAEAIAEAVQRPTMKFVATKTADQLDLQALHRVWCSRRNSFGHVAFRTHWNGGMVHHSKIGSRCPAWGRVSRGSPVQTALRNCTRDEGRPFEFDNQVLISSHRKLLSSKAMLVNVAEKSERDFGRYD